MWRSRTFWRLFGTIAGLLLVSIGFLGTMAVQRFERFYLQQFEQSLRTKALLIRVMIGDWPSRSSTVLQERIRDLGAKINTRITIIGATGTVLADTDEDPVQMENHAARPEVSAARNGDYGTAVRYSDTLQQSMMYVALKVDHAKDSAGFVRVALPLDEIHEQLGRLRRFVWTTAGLTAMTVLVLAFWPARRMTQPLQELTSGAERIVAGEAGQKIFTIEAGEVGKLARTFNRMSDRLSDQLAQIEADRQQLRAILDGMIEGVVALNAEQQVLFANDRASQFLDINVAEATGRKFWEVIRQRSLHDLVQKALANQSPCSQEVQWSGAQARSLLVHAVRLSHSVGGVVLVLHDTTEMRRLERTRQEFVANVSHELKTPLAVIKACLETLLDGALADPEYGKRFLQRASAQAERLHMLIQDLLSLARIESGEESLDIQAISIHPVMNDCVERHRAQAAKKDQSLETRVDPAGQEKADGPFVLADEDALTHVLDNLIDNAVKYTPEGGRIQVVGRLVDGQVCIDVSDSGIGIPERDLPRVFERFYRVDKARSRELGGTGLGLAIVKHLVQAMGGKVSAQSTLGQGSVFSVCLRPAHSHDIR